MINIIVLVLFLVSFNDNITLYKGSNTYYYGPTNNTFGKVHSITCGVKSVKGIYSGYETIIYTMDEFINNRLFLRNRK